jgi:DNA-binding GntR family transcriptional regulator
MAGPRDGTERFPTRSSAVADAIRRDIVSGVIPPGAHLRQAAIAKDLGVSTTPVREAFVALRREGLVLVDSHKGVVVFRPAVEDLVENYVIRIALESLAARHAVPRLDAEALDDLEQLLAAMKTASPRRYIDLNRQFHRRIYVAAEMPRLLECIETLRDASVAYLIMIVGENMTPEDERVHHEHVGILEACRERDADLAASLMAGHLERMLNRIEHTVRAPAAPGRRRRSPRHDSARRRARDRPNPE